MTTPLRLGIAGLGTVGTGVVRIVQRHADRLAARDFIPARREYAIQMRVSGHPFACMLDEQQLAVPLQGVASVNDLSSLRGPYRRSTRRRDVEAVIPAAIRLPAKLGDHGSFHRRQETARGPRLCSCGTTLNRRWRWAERFS